MSRSYYDDYPAPAPTADDEEPEDDSGKRKVWEILSWIVLALTLILNIVVIGVLAVRRNVISVINKGNGKFSIPWAHEYKARLYTFLILSNINIGRRRPHLRSIRIPFFRRGEKLSFIKHLNCGCDETSLIILRTTSTSTGSKATDIASSSCTYSPSTTSSCPSSSYWKVIRTCL